MATRAYSAEVRLHAADELNARLNELSGVLTALITQYTTQKADEMDHPMSAPSMLDALSALRFLLSEAHDAAGILSRPQP